LAYAAIFFFLAFALYFTFPANLFVYGVNDFADYDTDKFNSKKQ
jgi:4-hydroxybenzoate polyprenyltransferase